jgi:hypothetical protein
VTEPTNAEPDEPTAGEPTDQERVAAAAPVPIAEPAAPAPAKEPATEPATEPAKGPEPPAVDPVERFRTRHAVPPKGSARGLWLAAVALLVALGALGATLWVQYRAHWSGFLTTSATPTGPNPQQVADAKARACAAYELASKAVNASNSASANPGSEPAAANVNYRLALAQANTYLVERLDPATPPPLADAIRNYADNVADVTTWLLAGIGPDDPAQAARIKDLGPLDDQITDMCK